MILFGWFLCVCSWCFAYCGSLFYLGVLKVLFYFVGFYSYRLTFVKYWFHWYLQLSRLYTEIISKYTCAIYFFNIHLLHQNETIKHY